MFPKLSIFSKKFQKSSSPYLIKIVSRYKAKDYFNLGLFSSLSTTAAFTSVQKSDDDSKDISDYCMTPGCVKAASQIIQNMDDSVNPCDDFYQFACGGFIKKTAIPEDRTRMSSFSVLSDELLSQVSFFLLKAKFHSV